MTRILGENDANGDLREFGLFGGDASAAADSQYPLQLDHAPTYSEDATLVIERVIDIQFSINRS